MSVTAKALINSKFASNSTTTEYTAPSSTRTIVDKFTASNDSAGAVTLDVYFVPSGGSAGSSNRIIKALSISAGAAEDITKLQNQVLNTGDFIAVSASSSSAIVIRASGRECT